MVLPRRDDVGHDGFRRHEHRRMAEVAPSGSRRRKQRTTLRIEHVEAKAEVFQLTHLEVVLARE